ncbi:MAG: aryl-sulfate sulfotransferase [Ignavibacteriaceae bacterium]
MSIKQNLYGCVILLIAFNYHLIAQGDDYSYINYISPVPNSQYVSPLSNIIVRTVDNVEKSVLAENNMIEVTGKISGLHNGELLLLEDNKTILFNPELPFIEGEKITVLFKDNTLTTYKNKINDLIFEFTISNSWERNIRYSSSIPLENELNSSISFESEAELKENRNPRFSGKLDTLPSDFPEYYISVFNNPSDGYIFMAPFPWPPFGPGYMIIMDNYGVPIFYRSCPIRCMDFKLNGNGLITYFNRSIGKFYSLDSSYAMVDSFTCGNGYSTNVHDLQVLANGHSLLMSYDYQTVRMDTIVPGGDTAASVIGLIIQELDETKNVVFQWRSWDHFLITDATDNIDLTAHTIDYVHGNSIELDIDGNLIISCRHMDEITKINRTTGEIIWRLGGKNNQFQFVKDPRGFSHQHDARRISNGNLMLFDNGNLLSPRHSSSLEYQLDETDKIANLVWNYSDIPHYASFMGNSTRLSNGKTFIGWGSNFNPAITEVENDETKTFELYFNSALTYRVFRFPWRTNLLTANSYRIDFEYIPVNTSETKELVITNNSDEVLQITSNYSRSSMFSVVDSFPITLQPYQNRILQIQFFPDSIGVFSDDIHLRMQKENEMIAQVIHVLGYSGPSADVELENNYPNKFSLTQNFPNPFNPNTTIKYQIPEISVVTIKVYDVLGNEIKTLVNQEKSVGSYEVEFGATNSPSGIYFYRLQAMPTGRQAGSFIETKKMVLMK